MARDLGFTFGPDLREILNAPADVRAECAELEERADAELETRRRAALLGQLGPYLRMLGELDRAERVLTEAWRLQPTVAATLRLAHVHQWQGRLLAAEELMRGALADAEDDLMKSFALQHLGKCLLEQKKRAEAVSCFREALALRERLGRQDLVDSSRFALERALQD